MFFVFSRAFTDSDKNFLQNLLLKFIIFLKSENLDLSINFLVFIISVFIFKSHKNSWSKNWFLVTNPNFVPIKNNAIIQFFT